MNILDLENERGELEFRLGKLLVFLNKQKEEQTVSDAQLDLLYRQYVYMQEYMNILNHRIKDLDLERGL
ncbi:crAss001_48 related protein [uncultured Limosilactobacillus sp.]|uniref:crAss001_48 related protein n=1 Tax=uncultured Limosilactobacillus sp. TaxID=2837629 RepID=UPI0025977B0C|nr:hypothetical protein [uncultured Limosilactobacillus sp.]